MELSEHAITLRELEGMTAVYSVKNGVVSFTCVPKGREKEIKPRKIFREFLPKYKHICPSSMVQAARKGDRMDRDFSAGTTLHDAETASSMRAQSQSVTDNGEKRVIETVLSDGRGLSARHIVSQYYGYTAAECVTEYENTSEAAVTLDLAASFSIGGLTPFSEENDAENLILHRLQSNWSGEGRKESVSAAHYNLEDAWSSLGVRSVRFGQRGSMPGRGYLPFAALEDKTSGVTWAVQIEAQGSWQLEILHKNSALGFEGGLADWLYGHWRKTLAPGEKFVTPTAYFTVVNGGLTAACAALTAYQDNLFQFPASEQSLPVVYNEFLYNWGKPEIARLRPQMRAARELGAEYFVIDAGWFCADTDCELGEWNVNRAFLPQGLGGIKCDLDGFGYTAGGVWFEFEGVTDTSSVSKKTDWLLHADGVPVRHGNRYLLDFRNEEVQDYLTEKVICALNESGLRYIKIDYNENTGMAADGDESPGEGLRRHMLGVQRFYRKLRDGVPGLVMEVCSSGGMRHEPFFMTVGSMVSFSDAHEGAEGAVIAAQLHRVMQPRVMQIWACVKPEYAVSDAYFTMVKSMLGRICLSGDLAGLPQNLKSIVRDGIAYYQTIKSVIKNGSTVLIDTDEIASLRHIKGAVRLARKSKDGELLLCYGFAFNESERRLPFDCAGYKLISSFGDGVACEGEIVTSGARWSGTLMLLQKQSIEQFSSPE